MTKKRKTGLAIGTVAACIAVLCAAGACNGVTKEEKAVRRVIVTSVTTTSQTTEPVSTTMKIDDFEMIMNNFSDCSKYNDLVSDLPSYYERGVEGHFTYSLDGVSYDLDDVYDSLQFSLVDESGRLCYYDGVDNNTFSSVRIWDGAGEFVIGIGNNAVAGEYTFEIEIDVNGNRFRDSIKFIVP